MSISDRKCATLRNAGPDPPGKKNANNDSKACEASSPETDPKARRAAARASDREAERPCRGRSPRIAAAPVAKKVGKLLQALDGFPPCPKCFDAWKPMRGTLLTWHEDLQAVIAMGKRLKAESEQREQGPSRPEAPLPSPEGKQPLAGAIGAAPRLELGRASTFNTSEETQRGQGAPLGPEADGYPLAYGLPQQALYSSPEPQAQRALRGALCTAEGEPDGLALGAGSANILRRALETSLEKSEKLSLAKAEAAACSSGSMEMLTRIAQDYTTMAGRQAPSQNGLGQGSGKCRIKWLEGVRGRLVAVLPLSNTEFFDWLSLKNCDQTPACIGSRTHGEPDRELNAAVSNDGSHEDQANPRVAIEEGCVDCS